MNNRVSIVDRIETGRRLRIVKRGLLYYVEADMGFDNWVIVDSFLTKRGAKHFIMELEDSSSVWRGNRSSVIGIIE